MQARWGRGGGGLGGEGRAGCWGREVKMKDNAKVPYAVKMETQKIDFGL